MAKNLTIAIEISRSSLSKDIIGWMEAVKGVEAVNWPGPLAEKGPIAVKNLPDIILIDDDPASGEIFQRIQSIKGNFPGAALIILSDNKDPQHIIAAMKAGVAEYLVHPVEKKVFLGAIEDIRSKLATSGSLAQGRIYSLVSAKGGVGSTVLAVNTATALALDKKANVALIDMAFQSGDSSVLLDIVPQTTILDICLNMHRFDIALLRGVMAEHSTGVNFLAAPLNPEDKEDIQGEHITSILSLSRKLFDHVVLDCGSMNFNDCTLEAFKQSDKIFVVTDMSVPSIRNTVRLCKMARKFNLSFDKIEIVINRFIKGGALSLEEIEKNFDKKVYWLFPNDFSDIISSINRGVPLVKLSPGVSFSKNIIDFTKKIQGTLKDQTFRGIKGAFGKSL